MLHPVKALTAAAMALTLSLPAFAQDTPTADTVVATINGTDITLGQVILIRSQLPEQYNSLPTDALWDGILNQLVQQEALSQTDLASETREVRLALANERRALLASRAIQGYADNAVSDEDIQAYYQENYVEGESGKEFNASHILVETEDAAQALVEQLNGGADFAELAKAESTGPSGPNGGSLGWFKAGMMVPAFQEAVEALEPGTVSAPVQTQFGWHVIMLNETRDLAAPALDTVIDEIRQTLLDDKVRAFIDGTVEAADVDVMSVDDIDTSVLNKIELLVD